MKSQIKLTSYRQDDKIIDEIYRGGNVPFGN